MTHKRGYWVIFDSIDPLASSACSHKQKWLCLQAQLLQQPLVPDGYPRANQQLRPMNDKPLKYYFKHQKHERTKFLPAVEILVEKKSELEHRIASVYSLKTATSSEHRPTSSTCFRELQHRLKHRQQWSKGNALVRSGQQMMIRRHSERKFQRRGVVM